MEVIQLKHDKSLKYRNFKGERNLDFSIFREPEKLLLVSIGKVNNNSKDHKVIEINGTTRFLFEPPHDVCLYNIQTRTPFYAHLIWDIAHQLKIGNYLYVFEDLDDSCILQNSYFKNSFQLIEEQQEYKIFRKTSQLIIEKDKGFDSWTIGIPVGPEEPTFLNYCVSRIIELGIDDLEIILCGKPHSDFKYFNAVKIIGEDIPAPPVHITKKKNEIAKHASKNNLCIIHDRVLLPLNFLSAMKTFGDFFPFVGFQSFYFVDKLNLIPRRYSDFNTISDKLDKYFKLHSMNKKDIKTIANSLSFYYQNPLRSNHGKDYLTGSLYICKTSLWNYCPQNEKLYWDDFEDVEHGIRAASVGIPVIVNPYTITQSMNSRSIIHYYGYINLISNNGKIRLSRAITEILPFIKRKPLFRISIKEAKRRLHRFASKYGADDEVLRSIVSESLSGYSRLSLISKIIHSINIPVWLTEQFVKDFSANVLFESIPPEHYERLKRLLTSNINPRDKKLALIHYPFLQNQVSHSLFHHSFEESKDSWGLRKTKSIKYSNLISASYLKYFYRGVYLPMSVKEIAKLMEQTTMYINEDN
ncbi:hypothetical protein [Photorhabdus bodei]|uniref:Uncharacterized protein n=1 Tax=Photorhabdus bodei TaxID=2029681 RepID=A0A329X788_9GAMM|nr:hypothetical protein [Photorhabdus bodei]RAX12739.1 hypothetical protein CKY02_10310 [Photorhabdus bodei]